MNFRSASLRLALAAPLALALAACDETTDDTSGGELLEAIAAPEGTDWNSTVTISEEQGYVVGNPDAPLKLVEYASHTCPACASFAINGKPSLKEYIATGNVSFEQQEVFLNTFDVVIAGLAMCGPDERYQALSDEVWVNLGAVQQGLGRDQAGLQAANALELDQRFVRIAEVSGLLDFFAARGVSADQGRACLGDADAMQALVERVSTQASEVNIQGTPTFFLNGNRVEGISWDDIEPQLQRRGARPAAANAAAE
ncbi:MAG: thioredoxin domain-containing protein [Pseudomonadota bacterium]